MSLGECEWFWPGVSREDAAAAMKDQPDGTFLVRTSSTRVDGEYTLTLRKEGTNRLIRIIGRDGKFGFAEPLEFNSLPAVIDHHRTNSLAPYNRMLDICLTNPLSRHQNTIDPADREKILQQLRDHSVNYHYHSTVYDRVLSETTYGSQEVSMMMQAMEAFDAAVQMFEEQIKIHQQFQRDAKPADCEAIKSNYNLLKSRLDGIISSRAKLQLDVDLQTQKLRNKENELLQIKPQINHLSVVRADIIKMLTRSGMSNRELEGILQESAKVGEHQGECLRGKPVTYNDSIQEESVAVSPALLDDSAWYIPTATREQADKLLANKPAGTFLIRRRKEGSQGETHALSVVVNGKPGHCIINQKGNSFGFAAPDSSILSLRDLVAVYSKKSLVEHNPSLNVCLIHPVNAVQLAGGVIR